MKSQLKSGVLLSYAALFINSAISIVYTPIMLNLLGQSEYGLYSLASSTIAYIAIIDFGLGNAVIRYAARFRVNNDEKGCAKLYGMFLILYGILGALALISGMILTFFSDNIFSKSLSVQELHKIKTLLSIMAINTSLSIGLGLFSVIILAQEKFIIQKLISILGAVISPLIMYPLLLTGHGSVTMSVVALLINIVTILVNIFCCFKVLKVKISFQKIEMSLIKEVLVFSSYIFLNLIIGKIYWSTDQIILGIYSGAVAVSIYSIGASFTGYFSGFSSAISNVFLSKVSGMVSKEVADEEISNLFIRVGRIQYLIISVALSGFIVFGQEFINLWVGEDYKESFIIALIILIPMIVSLIQSMGGIILQAKNMQKFKSVVNLILAIINVFISILFVQWWGAIGCAVGTAIAFTLGNIIIINIYYWKKIKINVPLFWGNILRMSIPFGLSLIFSVTINKLIIANNWIEFFIKIFIFIVVYTLLLWLTSMNKYEKEVCLIPLINIVRKLNLKRKLYKVG